MNDSVNRHVSVLLEAAIEGLNIKSQGIYLDATFGRGGHSRAILSQLDASGRLIGLDKDLEAIKTGNQLATEDTRFSVHHTPFDELDQIAESLELCGQIDGILFDLGVSSPQLDDAGRGFSFTHDGPLDMRMNQAQEISAKEWVAETSGRDIAWALKHYGEEKFAKPIARAIVQAREIQTIETTRQLANIVSEAMPIPTKNKHPATRTFQAIRMAVNEELQQIERALSAALKVLKPGGRLVVISFHSLEDRLVKQYMRKASTPDIPDDVPVMADNMPSTPLRTIGKAIKPGKQECDINPRARSAVMRIAEAN